MTTESEHWLIHTWLKKEYGKANKCEMIDCDGTSKSFQWALLKDKNYEKNRENFWQLCAKCHRRYDLEHKNIGKYLPASVQVRIKLESYDLLRAAAFKRHVPMTEILEELIEAVYGNTHSK